MAGDSLKLPSIPIDAPDFAMLFDWNPIFSNWLTLLIRTANTDDTSEDEVESEVESEVKDENGLGSDETEETEYSSYRIKLDIPKDQSWFQKLPNWRRIKSLVQMYGQVAYWPATGEIQDLGDTKDDERTNRIRRLFTEARRERKQQQQRENQRDWKVSTRRNSKPKSPYLSP